MNEDYLFENEEYKKIVTLLKKITSSMLHTAPEGRELKFYLLAEKYSQFFTFEEEEPQFKTVDEIFEAMFKLPIDKLFELMAKINEKMLEVQQIIENTKFK